MPPTSRRKSEISAAAAAAAADPAIDDEISQPEPDFVDSEPEDQHKAAGKKRVLSASEKSANRQEQKKLKHERRAAKPHSEVVQQLKALWERARATQSKEEKVSLVGEMFELGRDKFCVLIFRHDASRIVQFIVKHATAEQKAAIATSLLGSFDRLAAGKYSKHLVVQLLRSADPLMRGKIVQELAANSRRLARHKEGGGVLEMAFLQFSNATQRRLLFYDCYGPQFRLFCGDASLTGRVSLADFVKDNPSQRESVASFIHSTLSSVLERGLAGSCFFHQLALDYCTVAATQPQVAEFALLARDQLVEMLHTHVGHRLVSLCLVHLSPKERKVVVKAFRPFVERIAGDEFGYLVLLTLFSVVDDTVLLEKYLIRDFSKLFMKSENEYVRKVAAFLVCGPIGRVFAGDVTRALAEYQALSKELGNSKKDPLARSQELMGQFVADAECYCDRNPEATLQNVALGEISIAVLRERKFESPILKSVLAILHPDSEAISTVAAGRWYRRLIKEAPGIAAPSILAALEPALKKWCQSETGGFLLLSLLNEPATKADLRSKLQPFLKTIQKAETKSRSLLIEACTHK